MGDWDVVGSKPIGDWDVVGQHASDEEPADHGLSERQKLSPMGKALSPITGYWPTYQRMRGEAYNQAAKGIDQIMHPGTGTDPYTGTEGLDVGNLGAGVLNTAAGGFNYLVGSPINAAYRSIIGQPLEDTTGIPREYSELAAQLATPGIGFGKLPTAPGTVADAGAAARVVGRPGETAGVADGSAPQINNIGRDFNTPEAIANRKLAEEFDFPLTRGQALEDADLIRHEDMSARGTNGKEMQDVAKPAFEDQFEAIQNAGKRVGQQLDRGENPLNSPADAASSLNLEVADKAAAARAERDQALQAAEAERARRVEEADKAFAAAREQADQRLAQGRELTDQGVAQQRDLSNRNEQTIGQAIAESHGEIENPRAAGEIVNRDVRDAAAAHRADFNARYDEFGRQEGSLQVNHGLGTSIREQLGLAEHPVEVDEGTPVASRALARLDRTTTPADADTPLMFDLKGVDRMRKLLVSDYKKAPFGSEDRRAMRAIMNSYDDHIERAISDGLFSGDPRALEMLREARGSYARYQQTYLPQTNDGGVGDAMRRIVQRNATAEETANLIIGSGKIGQAGLPVRLADRLEQVLGANSEAWNSIRQAIWQKASQVRNAAGDGDALKSANSIRDFAGSSLAQRMFTPEELMAMRNHGEGLRGLHEVSEAAPAAQKAAIAEHAQATKAAKIAHVQETKATQAAHAEATAKANNAYQGAFGGKDFTGQTRAVFNRMAEGTATPEETANAMFSVIAGGNPGHAVRALKGIERVVGKDSPVMGSIRQGVWQKLTQNPIGKDPKGQQMLAQNINEFLNGKGRTIAHQLYNDEERALMQRYADAVKKTVIGKYSRTNSDTAVAAGAQNARKVEQIASAISHIFHMGPIGRIGGHAVAKMIGKRLQGAATERSVQALKDSVNDVVPKEPPMTMKSKPPRAPSPVRPFAIPRPDQRREDRP